MNSQRTLALRFGLTLTASASPAQNSKDLTASCHKSAGRTAKAFPSDAASDDRQGSAKREQAA